MSENQPVSREELTRIVIDALEDVKARDIRVLDVQDKSTITDLLIIASGTSTRHVGALAENVIFKAKHEAGIQPFSTEGELSNDWVVVDLLDVVVHIFTPETRDFYNLEKLWDTPPADAGQAE
ncbi:MAG TPA: ribosome silencing factor [Gammaproteobacteria bacterium]|nr:ribosome silencing factor [Gammaproteobacteria bacterium]